MKSILLIASLTAAATFGIWSHVSSTSSKPSGTTGAISRYVAAEDNDFADLTGALQQSNTEAAYYASREPLPGSSACVIFVHAARNDHLGGCTFEARSFSGAAALYRSWIANVRSALPQWKTLNPRRLPSGDVAATVFTDASQVHAVLVDIFNDPQSGYRVTTTFAKMSVLHS